MLPTKYFNNLKYPTKVLNLGLHDEGLIYTWSLHNIAFVIRPESKSHDPHMLMNVIHVNSIGFYSLSCQFMHSHRDGIVY